MPAGWTPECTAWTPESAHGTTSTCRKTHSCPRPDLSGTGTHLTVGKSVLDPTWHEDITQRGTMLFIIEGLSMYLQPEEVTQMLRIIHDNFDNAYVMMETTSPFWVRKQSIEKSVQGTGAIFTWGVNRFSEMQDLAQGFHSVKDDNILRGMAKLYPAYRLISWLPVVKNMAEKILIFQKD